MQISQIDAVGRPWLCRAGQRAVDRSGLAVGETVILLATPLHPY